MADADRKLRPWEWYAMPWRLFRERTSVQLIVSHIVVVLITVVLIYGFIVASILGYVPFSTIGGLDSLTIDPYLGERARSYIYWMDPDRIAADIANNETGAADLTASLLQITSASVPGFELPEDGAIISHADYAAIVDTTGNVVATSDPSWIATSQQIDAFPRQATRNVATYALEYAPGMSRASLYGIDVSDSRTSAAMPVITSEGAVVGALIIEGGTITDVVGGSRASAFRILARQYVRQIWIFMIPAIIVAIPIGVWRSRVLSRRLRRLEGAASALAEGNLKTRVHVTRHDEIGKLAERFNQMGEHMDRTDRERRAFVSNVSHELRTPVAIIQGATERLIDQQHQGETVDPQTLGIVQRETETLSRLIDDLFTLTRIEEHNLRLDREPVSVSAIARETVRSMSDLAWAQRRVHIESLVPADLPTVMADRTRLRQIFNNLLYNALRHTPEGGLVVVQGKDGPNAIELSISDTGMGIPPEALANVFERYFQGERSQRNREGSGLGLSIVRQLVEAHGGTITVESMVGQGTTFRFTLPYDNGAP